MRITYNPSAIYFRWYGAIACWALFPADCPFPLARHSVGSRTNHGPTRGFRIPTQGTQEQGSIREIRARGLGSLRSANTAGKNSFWMATKGTRRKASIERGFSGYAQKKNGSSTFAWRPENEVVRCIRLFVTRSGTPSRLNWETKASKQQPKENRRKQREYAKLNTLAGMTLKGPSKKP